jgi:hypothetical protein
MHSLMTPRVLGATIALAALAACNGGQIAPAPSLDAASDGAPLSTSAKQTIPKCKAPFEKLPGVYALMFANGGTLTSSTYTSGTSTDWFAYKWQKDTLPTPSPGPTPKPQTVWYYYGTYALHKYGVGCTFLITGVNNKPIKVDGKKQTADVFGGAQFKKSAIPNVTDIVDSGTLKWSLKNLTANGGQGTVTLFDSTGTADTGTITLLGRVTTSISI